MKLAYRPKSGYILLDTAKRKWLSGLTYNDACDLMALSREDGRMSYDRRRSFKIAKNRAWADGVQWTI